MVFAEDFETPTLDEVQARWSQVNRKITSLSEDVPSASRGKKSVLFTHVGGQSEGGHLYKS